jgi:hypothetical protein
MDNPLYFPDKLSWTEPTPQKIRKMFEN